MQQNGRTLADGYLAAVVVPTAVVDDVVVDVRRQRARRRTLLEACRSTRSQRMGCVLCILCAAQHLSRWRLCLCCVQASACVRASQD